MKLSPKKNLVSSTWLLAAGLVAEAAMAADPQLREAWLDQNRTSAAEKKAGGLLHFETDHDWVLAFFVWRANRDADMPRVK